MQKLIYITARSIKEPKELAELVGHLDSRYLYWVQLGVLPNSSPATCTLKKLSGQQFTPLWIHLLRTMISLWLKALRIHYAKAKQKRSIKEIVHQTNPTKSNHRMENQQCLRLALLQNILNLHPKPILFYTVFFSFFFFFFLFLFLTW